MGIFDALGGHLGVQIGVEGGEGTVNLHGGEGGPVAGDGEYDHHNSTFDEKTLPDGSVVRVNRTVIKDTDENGNSFFFSSSVHHVLQEGGEEEQESEGDAVDEEEEEDKGDDEEEEDIEEEEKEGEEEIPVIEEDFNVDQYDERQNSSPQTLTRPPTMWTSRKMRLKEKPRRNLTELMRLRQWRIFSKFRSHLFSISE